jgi:hypothetical protein
MFTAASEPFALAIRYSVAASAYWLGADASGTLTLSDVGGNGRLTLTQAGALNVPGTITAGAFVGNGSGLTGIAGGGVTTQTQPTRALGTTYQNTTGKPLFITVHVRLQSNGSATFFTDAAPTPTTNVGFVWSVTADVTHSISFWVLPGNYYRSTSGGTVTLGTWTEWS